MQVPLPYWKKGRPGFQPPEKFERTDIDLIEPNFEVSGGDRIVIQRLYPWT
jgi:hypothetical protein